MTSKLKCPICGGDIQYNDSYSTYDCKNNPSEHYASEEVWQALIESHKSLVLSEQSADREIHRLRDLLSQSQKDLVIAKSTLEYLGYEFPPAYPEKNVIAEMRQKARNAVKYIEHKE